MTSSEDTETERKKKKSFHPDSILMLFRLRTFGFAENSHLYLMDRVSAYVANLKVDEMVQFHFLLHLLAGRNVD